MNKLNKASVAVGILLTSVIGFASTAFATTAPADPTAMATDAAADLTPIILGVGGALVAVAVVRFGVRWVLSSVGRGGRA